LAWHLRDKSHALQLRGSLAAPCRLLKTIASVLNLHDAIYPKAFIVFGGFKTVMKDGFKSG
jgi:hypothetical protein